MNKSTKIIYLLAILISIGGSIFAQKKELPPADLANVAYGPHGRNVLDVWFADSTKTTPLAIYIHGGGFTGGSKESLKAETLSKFLEAGIAVAAINYRLIKHAPLPAPHYDGRTALQFIRSQAKEWLIDKHRIGAFGGSAGAQICMWLAFSDDMANPASADPIEQESTRLTCVSTFGGQTTVDLDWWVEWIPGYNEHHVDPLAMSASTTLEDARVMGEKISALSIVSADDPPIFMGYGMAPDAPIPSIPKKAFGWKIHHVIFGIKLKEKMDEIGVESHLQYPGVTPKYSSNVHFFKSKLFPN
ncbi:MAG: alpha/beta hydrolase [Saprospiraceae bacterium]|nr:alpha/beta hydrolase [Saprospiraceae bacterium]